LTAAYNPTPPITASLANAPAGPEAWGSFTLRMLFRFIFTKKKLALFPSSNELFVPSFSEEKLDGKQHQIVEQNPKTRREDGETARGGRASARAD